MTISIPHTASDELRSLANAINGELVMMDIRFTAIERYLLATPRERYKGKFAIHLPDPLNDESASEYINRVESSTGTP